MLKLSYHIVIWFVRSDKVVVFCNVVTTAASDRKITERSWNYSPTAKMISKKCHCICWFQKTSYVYMEASAGFLLHKKNNPLNLLTCSRIPHVPTFVIVGYVNPLFFTSICYSTNGHCLLLKFFKCSLFCKSFCAMPPRMHGSLQKLI